MLGNLIVDHPCYGQLTAVRKGYRLSVSHDCIAGSSVKLIEVTCFFFKLSTGQLLVLIDHRLRSKNSHKLSKKLCLVVSISSPSSFRFKS